MKLYRLSEISELSNRNISVIKGFITKKKMKPYKDDLYTEAQMYMMLGVVVKEIEKIEVIKVTQNWLIVESKMNKL